MYNIFFLANPASTASEKKGDPNDGSTALCLSFHSFSSSLSCHHSTPWLAATNNCDRPFSGAKAATARGPFAPERWSWLPWSTGFKMQGFKVSHAYIFGFPSRRRLLPTKTRQFNFKIANKDHLQRQEIWSVRRGKLRQEAATRKEQAIGIAHLRIAKSLPMHFHSIHKIDDFHPLPGYANMCRYVTVSKMQDQCATSSGYGF